MKSLIASITILGLAGMMVVVGAGAADTAAVGATVTVQNISITVSDGAVAYGTLAVSSAKNTTSGDLNDSQTVTNNGNVTEDFTIRGQDSANWTLGNAAGSDVYKHEFCTSGAGSPDPCDASPSYTTLTTSNATLATGVAVNGTQLFDLQFSAPTSSSNFTEQSVDVTIVATAS